MNAATDSAAAERDIALAPLIERLVRGLERGGKYWTVARRKDSLNRVLAGGRRDPERLKQRLSQLVASWDDDNSGSTVELASTEPAPLDLLAPAATASVVAAPIDTTAWSRIVGSLAGTVRHALPPGEPRAEALIGECEQWHGELSQAGASVTVADRVDDWSERARRLLAHRHHLLDQMGKLTEELSAGLAELAEDDSWARGQGERMRQELSSGLSARSVRSVSQLLADTRARQRSLREERAAAREALKSALQRMLHEVGELGSHTGRFEDHLGRYAEVIEKADSLESLAGAVREMVEESRSVRALVQGTQQRLADEHSRASELADRVRSLEDELRRLSDEVSTDPLTGVANRRGLLSAYDTECARAQREGGLLAVGLLDIDDFKRLNDSLGHAAGDQALVALAQHVQKSLRPGDHVARFGGEEFVVMLPQTPLAEAQQTLTRLQRALSASLFLHNEKPVLVTFSAGVTLAQPGERIEQVLERADEALYEAKRTGKNRTCMA
jgi:diguanylate cyclase